MPRRAGHRSGRTAEFELTPDWVHWSLTWLVRWDVLSVTTPRRLYSPLRPVYSPVR